MLSLAEERAIAHIAGCAQTLAQHRPSSACATADELTSNARVTLNFHPDRMGRNGMTVAEGLLRDGVYRSQFATGITNGSPTAFPGGERDLWERELFGGAYHTDVLTTPGQERPKYGAFNVMAYPDGGSPRFGSCYFELSRPVVSRCTFSWGDSYEKPEHVGTIGHFEAVRAAWLESANLATLAKPRSLHPAVQPPGRALDTYIEAHVHGQIDLSRDVEALVIDPAFDETETGLHLAAIAARHGFELRRHAGFVLHPAEVPSDFRGPRMPALAERIAGGNAVDAATLGRAARSLFHEPARWHDWGSEAETWQNIKQLWHVLVRFGNGRARPTA